MICYLLLLNVQVEIFLKIINKNLKIDYYLIII